MVNGKQLERPDSLYANPDDDAGDDDSDGQSDPAQADDGLGRGDGSTNHLVIAMLSRRDDQFGVTDSSPTANEAFPCVQVLVFGNWPAEVFWQTC